MDRVISKSLTIPKDMNTNNIHLKKCKSTVFFWAIILVFATGSVACFGSKKDKPEADIVIQINAANFHNIDFPAELFTDASHEEIKNVIEKVMINGKFQ